MFCAGFGLTIKKKVTGRIIDKMSRKMVSLIILNPNICLISRLIFVNSWTVVIPRFSIQHLVIDQNIHPCYGVCMKRYQVYLNQGSVAVLDDYLASSGITRSDIIRQAVDSLAVNLSKVVSLAKATRLKVQKTPLDDLVGFIEASDTSNNWSERDDLELFSKS